MKTSARNASWIMVGKALSVVAQALYFIVLARLLGSQSYGVYVAAVAMVAVVNQYGSLGSGYVFLRYVSRTASSAPLYFGNVVLSTLTFGPLLILGLTLVGPKILHSDQRSLIFMIAVSDCLLSALVLASSQVFQALEQMWITATMSVVTDVLRLVAGLVLLIVVHSVTVAQAAGVTLAVSAVAAVFSMWIVFRKIGRPTFSVPVLREHAGEGLTFALSSSTTIISNDIDKVMLSHYGMNAANGVYSLAYRGVSAASMPLLSIYTALIPRFFQEGVKGVNGTYALAKRSLRKSVPISLAMALSLVVIAPLIPIFAGPSFQESVSALRWLCIIPFFRNLQWCAGDALTGAGHQGIRLGSQGIAAVFNFYVNLYLIPHYSWWGAAWSSVATDALLAAILWSVLIVMKRKAVETPEVMVA